MRRRRIALRGRGGRREAERRRAGGEDEWRSVDERRQRRRSGVGRRGWPEYGCGGSGGQRVAGGDVQFDQCLPRVEGSHFRQFDALDSKGRMTRREDRTTIRGKREEKERKEKREERKKEGKKEKKKKKVSVRE